MISSYILKLRLLLGLCYLSTILVSHAHAQNTAPVACSTEVISELCETATAANHAFDVNCHIDFKVLNCRQASNRPNVITKRLRFSGAEASGVVADFDGATIDAGIGTFLHNKQDIVEFVSRSEGDGAWSVPRNIVFRNAQIIGSLRLYGLGRNGEAPLVKASSRRENHVNSVRQNAPHNVSLESISITGLGRTPLYFGPGVTNSRLIDSEIDGESVRVAIYLDAESDGNVIKNNHIDVQTNDGSIFGFYDRGWPQLALDASSGNLIKGNRFERLSQGGIYLYRNCGEGGTLRHGSPSGNRILDNEFNYYLNDAQAAEPNPTVYIGSRDYGSFENRWPGTHCDDDQGVGLDIGSAVSNADHATDNVVSGNRVHLYQSVGMPRVPKGFLLKDRFRIRNNRVNTNNSITDNEIVVHRAIQANSTR